MRTFKFRVWDNNKKVFLRSYKNEGFAFGHGTDEAMNEFGCFSLCQCIDLGMNVLQYTGIKDSEGTDIYEGDLIQITYTHPLFKETLRGRVEVNQIYWDERFHGFYMKRDDRERITIPWTNQNIDTRNFKVKVIGNIFEK